MVEMMRLAILVVVANDRRYTDSGAKDAAAAADGGRMDARRRCDVVIG